MAYNKQTQQLLLNFADASDELLKLGVINTDSFTGEIGEFFACKAYNLKKSSRVNKGFDGICKLGKRYQVKAKQFKNSYNYSISGLNKNYFEYLVVIFFDKNYSPQKIIKIPNSEIHSDKFIISNSTIHLFENFNLKDLNVPSIILEKIYQFSSYYNALIDRNIIRSRRIVGDIGEFYAANQLKLKLEANKNSKGLDATDEKGITYEIKTRRVYDSDRRVSDRRRINGLVGKSAEFLIVVTLDRKFLCSGMWIIPMQNIKNPKSATLEIINTTPGVKNLVPSKISNLRSGAPFANPGPKYPSTKKKISKTNSPTGNKEIIRKIPSKRKKVKNEIHYTRNEKIGALLIILFLILLGYIL